MAEKPTITITDPGDAEVCHIVIQDGTTTRRFEAPRAVLEDRIVSVLIDAFRMPQDDARSHAQAQLAEQDERNATAAEDRKKIDDYGRVAELLADAENRASVLAKERDDAIAALKTAQQQLE